MWLVLERDTAVEAVLSLKDEAWKQWYEREGLYEVVVAVVVAVDLDLDLIVWPAIVNKTVCNVESVGHVI